MTQSSARCATDSPGVVCRGDARRPSRPESRLDQRPPAAPVRPHPRMRLGGRWRDRGPTACRRPRRLPARCRSRQQTGIGRPHRGPHRPVTGRSRRKPVAERPWDPPRTPRSRRRRDDRVGGHNPRSARTHRLPGPPRRTSERRPYPAPAHHPARRQHRTHLPTRRQRPAQIYHRPALIEGQGLAPNPPEGAAFWAPATGTALGTLRLVVRGWRQHGRFSSTVGARPHTTKTDAGQRFRLWQGSRRQHPLARFRAEP